MPSRQLGGLGGALLDDRGVARPFEQVRDPEREAIDDRELSSSRASAVAISATGVPASAARRSA
jgi:hypothetical protein